MLKRLKSRVYNLVEAAPAGERRPRLDWFDYFITTLILLNVLMVMLETVQALEARLQPFFRAFEIFSVTVFTIEYVLRIWSCTEKQGYRHPIGGRIRYALRPMSLIDLAAIIPFYLPMVDHDLRFLRAVRLVRLLLILKIGRYSESLHLLGAALKAKAAELVVMLVVLCVLLVLSAGLMYYAENAAQPAIFSSIPASLWWAVITLTTIGYGDAYPVTTVGRVIGGLIAVSGIGIVALPTAILASGFADEVHRRRTGAGAAASGGNPGTCPHCGREL